jgi:TolB-like protein
MSAETPKAVDEPPPTGSPGVVPGANLDAKVFVSYASRDVAVADAVVAALERHGVACWIAPRDVKGGALYADAIVRSISDAKALVLVLSENSIASAHVSKEVERASSKRRPVIALRIDDAPLSPALEYFLGESHWIDARAGGMDAAVAKLIAAIREPERTMPGTIPAVAAGTPAGTGSAAHPKPRRRRVLLAAGFAVVAVALTALLADKLWLSKHAKTESGAAPVASGPAAATPAGSAISEKSIAVLPFTDMSEKHDQEYFSDGLAEELLDQLAKTPGLHVIARTSSFYFKGKQTTIAEIAKTLGVSHVLEGSVRKAGRKVRVTAQLIRADNGYDIWSQTFDRDLKDIFQMQDEIAGAVVQALKATLNSGVVSSDRTSNVDAYSLLLQSRSLIARQTEVDLRQAARALQRAVSLDPNYVSAWAELVQAYVNLMEYIDANPAQDAELARTAAQKALALDPTNAAAHFALALVKAAYDHDWKEAIAETDAARRSDPAAATPVELVAIMGCKSGPCYDQVIRDTSSAIARDPLNAGAYSDRSNARFFGGQLAEAESDARRALELSPSQATGYYLLTLILIARHEFTDLLSVAGAEVTPIYRRASLAMAYQALGRRAEANAALRDLLAQDSDDAPYQIAQVYAMRGDNAAALDWLERDDRLHQTGILTIRVDPLFDSLRNEPRYLALMHKLGVAD